MYYSYVMGMDESILRLRAQGFTVKSDGGNYMVSFPKELAQVWESFVCKHLEVGYWNEYLADGAVVFLFHLEDGFHRYAVSDYENPKVLQLCEKLCACSFGSLKAMLKGNHFYQDKI